MPSAPRDRPIRVLSVEPGADGRPWLSEQLESTAADVSVYTVAEVDDSSDVLEIERFDCVVCRHSPPEVDAAELFSDITAAYPSLPVLVPTAPEDADDVAAIEDAELLQLSEGTVHPDILADRLRTLASSRRNRGAPLELLYEITSDPEASFEEQVQQILDLGAERFGVDIGFVSRIDEDTSDFEILEARGDHELLQPGAVSNLSETYCRRTIAADDTPLVIGDAERAGMEGDPAYEKYGLSCYFGVDLAIDGDLYGTLCFADTESTSRSFSEQDRTLLDLMARWLRKELEQRSYRQELEQYHTVTQTISDVIVTIDEDSIVQSVNPAIEDVLGYDPDALVGESITTIMPSRFEDRHRAAVETYLATGERSVDWEYLELPGQHRDGTEVPLAISFSEYEHEGEHYFTGVLRDITERKERERVFNGLLQTTQEFMRASDEGELADALIEAVEEVFGYEYSFVRLHDEETGTLPPSRVSSAIAEEVDLPTYGDDEGHIGEAFQSGESMVISDLQEATEYDYRPFASGIVLPLGEYGTVGIAAKETDAFDAEDRALTELLAVTATAAFDRVQRETDLRRFRRIIDHVEEMVFLLDEEGSFAFVTEPLVAHLGREAKEIDGEPISEILAADAVPECETHLETVRGEGGDQRARFEADLLGADAETLPTEIELSAFPGTDAAFVGSVTDISELTETRSRLERERDRFRNLFENLPDPVVECEFRDGEPIIQHVNPAFVAEFGYSRAFLEGESLNELIVPANDRETARTLDSRIMGGKPVSSEIQRETRDGLRDFLFRGIPYDFDDNGMFGVYTDITEQKERERYLQVMSRILRHNLRNDLNVVIALSQQIEAKTSGDLSDHAATLTETARGLSDLSEKAKEIKQLLDRDRSNLDPADIVPVVRDVVAEQRAAHPEAEITVDLPDELWVRADRDSHRVFEELIENAIEHNDASTPRVHLSAAPGEGEYARVRVTDNGSGIPDPDWRTVIEGADITQLSHGTGLGLWLARWILEQYGGEIRGIERGEDGTTIELRFVRTTAGVGGKHGRTVLDSADAGADE